MDFLNDTIAQVRDLFLSMTGGARIVSVLLLAVVVCSLGFLFQQGTVGPDTYLFGGEFLPASDLNKIEVALGTRGLSGYTREGNRIRIPAGEKADYLAAVADSNALPRTFHGILDSALDKGGMWESKEATRQRLRIAKANTLSEIIRAMPWVDDASVIYDEQLAMGLNRKKQVVASVSVSPLAGESLTHERKKKLQNAVAFAVLGLKPESVMITSLGDDSALGGGSMSPEVFESKYLRARARFNRSQRDKIYQHLSYIPNIRVEVNAELENVAEELLSSVKPDDKPQMVSESTTEDKVSRTQSALGGRPGTDAQGPYRDQGLAADNTNKDEEKSKTSATRSFVGHATQQIRKDGYVPKAVWATVAVPRTYLAELWHQQNPSVAGQTPSTPSSGDLRLLEEGVSSSIKKLVHPLLPGHIVGEDSYKYITVAFVDLIEPDAIPETSFANTAVAWTGRNWGNVSMAMLAAFSLLVLRSMANSAPNRTSPNSTELSLSLGDADPSSSTGGGTESSDQEDAEETGPRLKLNKSKSLKDDLAEIVREDPDAAATILRNWIENAA